jgi:DNA-binding transcriptional LysR family regulator
LPLADEARSRILEPDIEGTIRLGTPEDFATAYLPGVLARFARAYPRVALDVDCNFSANLIERFSRGEYDLVLVKREPLGSAGGTAVWRDVLVWVSDTSWCSTTITRSRSSSRRHPTSIASVRSQACRRRTGTGGSSTPA